MANLDVYIFDKTTNALYDQNSYDENLTIGDLLASQANWSEWPHPTVTELSVTPGWSILPHNTTLASLDGQAYMWRPDVDLFDATPENITSLYLDGTKYNLWFSPSNIWTTWQVLTKTAWGYEWDNAPATWIQNDTTWTTTTVTAIRAWTEAEYNALQTHSASIIYHIY